MAGSPCTSERGLSERTGGQEMEEREINDVGGKEVVLKDMDYAKLKNKVIKPKKRVAGEIGQELSSDEELRA
jgi:hypothetical protein